MPRCDYMAPKGLKDLAAKLTRVRPLKAEEFSQLCCCKDIE